MNRRQSLEKGEDICKTLIDHQNRSLKNKKDPEVIKYWKKRKKIIS